MSSMQRAAWKPIFGPYQKRYPIWLKRESSAHRLRSLFLNIARHIRWAPLIGVTVLLGFLTRDVLRSTILVDTFAVPEALAKRGFTSEFFVNNMIDQISEIEHNLEQSKGKFTYQHGPQLELPEFETPALKISYRALVQICKSLLRREDTRITGEITNEPVMPDPRPPGGAGGLTSAASSGASRPLSVAATARGRMGMRTTPAMTTDERLALETCEACAVRDTPPTAAAVPLHAAPPAIRRSTWPIVSAAARSPGAWFPNQGLHPPRRRLS